jgi:protein-arginine deiminase
MKAELGLLDEEIVLVASLFEEPIGCGPYVAALIPGMANLLVVNPPGEPTKIFTADPFVRSDLTDPSTDPIIADFVAKMPADVEVVFLDDWETYHLALGEVHCGTNGIRTPTYQWWLDDDGGAQ